MEVGGAIDVRPAVSGFFGTLPSRNNFSLDTCLGRRGAGSAQEDSGDHKDNGKKGQDKIQLQQRGIEEFTPKEYAGFQTQLYWIERALKAILSLRLLSCF